MPDTIKLLVLDFDGVVTDNRVWTDEHGREMVASWRSDSLRLKMLRKAGIETVILSSEPNNVVAARANKMGIEAIHGIGIHAKGQALLQLLDEKKIEALHTIYVGNDLNDLPCFEIAGWAVAVSDAYAEVLRAADYVLNKPGGRGALRELCDLLVKSIQENRNGS
jgi:N-acylneuraminate cytidylyltransferase